MLERQRTAGLLGPALLGLTGSMLVALAGPELVGGPVRWWYTPSLGAAAHWLIYAGMGGLLLAWLTLRRSAAVSSSPRRLGLIAGLWALPLLLAPPLFSHDVYSYLAQGTIAHLGLDPYQAPPTVLAHLGHPAALHAVSSFWRRTTAPYGPLFIALADQIAGLTGSHLVVGVLVLRVVDVLGLVLLVVYVPRLATRLGTQAGRAMWLAVLNPLVMLQLVAPGHNDLLMVGVMVAGIALALEGRWTLAMVACAVAATIKLPALAGAVFIAAAWARSLPSRAERVRALGKAAGACIATLVVVSLISGQGTDWLTSSVFSTPNRVHLAVTPSTALGWTFASLAGSAGWHLSTHHLESVMSLVSLALVALVALDRLRRVRADTLALQLGVVLVIFALGGPAAWPWYFAWGLGVLAACPPGPLAILLSLGSVVGAFLVKPDGILILPIQSTPAVLVVYVLGAAFAWRRLSAHPKRVAHAAA